MPFDIFGSFLNVHVFRKFISAQKFRKSPGNALMSIPPVICLDEFTHPVRGDTQPFLKKELLAKEFISFGPGFTPNMSVSPRFLESFA